MKAANIRSNSSCSALFLVIAVVLLTLQHFPEQIEAKFRPKLAWTSRPEFASYELFQIAHNYIKIAWKPATNNGFQYLGTDIDICERDDVSKIQFDGN